MDVVNHAEKEQKNVKEDEANLRELVRSLKEKVHKSHVKKKKLAEKLSLERTSAESFLISEVGCKYVVELKKETSEAIVKEFTDSAAFEEICMERAMPVYDDVVMNCQKILHDSGHVSEDIIQLLDAGAPEEKEVAENMHDLEAFGGYDEMIDVLGGEEDVDGVPVVLT